jgi:hypothetical protein
MYQVLYIGNRFDDFNHKIDMQDIELRREDCEDCVIKREDDIVFIDGASFESTPLAYASHLKSKSNLNPKVWIYISHPEIEESIEACYTEGFDDALAVIDQARLKVTLIKAQLLNSQRIHYIEQLDLAQDMARTAMTNSGELGGLVRLLTNLVKTDHFNDMGVALLEWFDEFHLQICVQVRDDDTHYEYSSTSIVQPIESEVLLKGASGDRIVELGKIYLFNEPHISILIKNMPIIDSDKVGRLRDHIAIILHTSEKIIESIQLKIKEKKESNKNISTGIEEFKNQVINMNEEMFQYINTSKGKFKSFTTRIYNDLQGLDLSDKQYERLVELIDEYEQMDEDYNDINMDIESKISTLEGRIRVALP